MYQLLITFYLFQDIINIYRKTHFVKSYFMYFVDEFNPSTDMIVYLKAVHAFQMSHGNYKLPGTFGRFTFNLVCPV